MGINGKDPYAQITKQGPQLLIKNQFVLYKSLLSHLLPLNGFYFEVKNLVLPRIAGSSMGQVRYIRLCLGR
jgi:hypothetical protein